MNERRQNLVVGLFVLIGLTILGFIIVEIGESPEWLSDDTYPIRIFFPGQPGAEGAAAMANLSTVQEGTVVTMQGLPIGRVKGLAFHSPAHPEEGTYVIAQVRKVFSIPVGAKANVMPAAIGFGRTTIDLVLPRTTQQSVPTDGTAIIPGSIGSPLDTIIPERIVSTLEQTARRIGDLAAQLTPVAADLHEILQLRPIGKLQEARQAGQPLTANLSSAIERLYNVLTHFDQVLGDPETQSNVRVAIANFRDVSEQAKAAAAELRAFTGRGEAIASKMERTFETADSRLDELARRLMHNSDQLARVLENLSVATHNLTRTDGTLGLFLNDPKLYQEMVLTVQQLKASIADLQKLIQKLYDRGLFGR